MGIDGVGPIAGGLHPMGRAPAAAPATRTGDGPQEMRAVLTLEELSYFAELEQLGPLTYGPRAAGREAAPAPVLGRRIDVRA